ncbi:HPF/RaiA family ribosome-associated protein [Kineosporia succinea]|uniref:Ribosome-associated translation inhibitor RaiA n=1 Tax=Kineosporia succinea TaxID=84632 RepID=A0ABT9PER6_9ACTN|nr:HPF/RaiA family ribosome-associated protein [Kineosporia succinea]MDP9831201.1 ribosome-associated translation inhibitor RaiA [Kineosporia succinea]
MQVQVQTDKHIRTETDWIEDQLTDSLARFAEQLVRVDVHLSDENGDKPGTDDIRCGLDARLAGVKDLVVTHSAGNVHDAFHGALGKLTKSLESSTAKLSTRRGRDSIRTAEPTELPEDIIS